MQAFFGGLREPPLKGSFIGGSGLLAHNPAVKAFCLFCLTTPDSRRSRLKIGLASLLLVGLMQPSAWASGSRDHERARAAVEAGQVLPLPTLLERLRRTHPGQVLELELEREDGRWIYEIKLLQANGQLLKLDVDAATAQVLQVKRRGGGKEGQKAERDPGRQATPSQESPR